MSEFAAVKSYYESIQYDERKKDLDLKRGLYPFVTISREMGAGGRSLAAAIVREIKEQEGPLFQGWQTVDDEICRYLESEPGIKFSVKSLLSKEYRSQIEDMLEEWIVGDSPQDVVIKRIFKTMRTLATFGKVILVGRAASCYTRDLPRGIHIRLVGSMPEKIKRVEKLLGVNAKKAREVIEEQDKARHQLVKTYFNREIADPKLYDVTWNTDAWSIDQIASLTVAMNRQKMEALDPTARVRS